MPFLMKKRTNCNVSNINIHSPPVITSWREDYVWFVFRQTLVEVLGPYFFFYLTWSQANKPMACGTPPQTHKTPFTWFFCTPDVYTHCRALFSRQCSLASLFVPSPDIDLVGDSILQSLFALNAVQCITPAVKLSYFISLFLIFD